MPDPPIRLVDELISRDTPGRVQGQRSPPNAQASRNSNTSTQRAPTAAMTPGSSSDARSASSEGVDSDAPLTANRRLAKRRRSVAEEPNGLPRRRRRRRHMAGDEEAALLQSRLNDVSGDIEDLWENVNRIATQYTILSNNTQNGHHVQEIRLEAHDKNIADIWVSVKRRDGVLTKLEKLKVQVGGTAATQELKIEQLQQEISYMRLTFNEAIKKEIADIVKDVTSKVMMEVSARFVLQKADDDEALQAVTGSQRDLEIRIATLEGRANRDEDSNKASDAQAQSLSLESQRSIDAMSERVNTFEHRVEKLEAGNEARDVATPEHQRRIEDLEKARGEIDDQLKTIKETLPTIATTVAMTAQQIKLTQLVTDTRDEAHHYFQERNMELENSFQRKLDNANTKLDTTNTKLNTTNTKLESQTSSLEDFKDAVGRILNLQHARRGESVPQAHTASLTEASTPTTSPPQPQPEPQQSPCGAPSSPQTAETPPELDLEFSAPWPEPIFHTLPPTPTTATSSTATNQDIRPSSLPTTTTRVNHHCPPASLTLPARPDPLSPPQAAPRAPRKQIEYLQREAQRRASNESTRPFEGTEAHRDHTEMFTEQQRHNESLSAMWRSEPLKEVVMTNEKRTRWGP